MSNTKSVATLKAKYDDEIKNQLKEQFKYQNVIKIPSLVKIVINKGVGQAIANANVMDAAYEELAAISGQKPVVRKAKKSISNFKIREGYPIGCSVTLRSDRMYDFLTKFVSIGLPKIRDFRGIPASGFDGRGNYTLGVKDISIFPEIKTERIAGNPGCDITFVTTAESDEEAFELLKAFGIPFRGQLKRKKAARSEETVNG